jgi:hypothetical protein
MIPSDVILIIGMRGVAQFCNQATSPVKYAEGQ